MLLKKGKETIMEAEKSKKTSSMYYTAMDVQEMLGISKGMAYKILRKLTAELAAKNYIVIPGKIPRAYFAEHYYGMSN